MLILAAISSSVGLLGWIIIGGLAGAVAGKVMRGTGFGLVGDVIVGVVGALVGVFLLGFLINADLGLIGSFVVALVGAFILLGVMRLVTGKKGRLFN